MNQAIGNVGYQVAENPDRVATERSLACLVILIVWLACFWPLLCGAKQPGFRDSATMYGPLFQWIDRQWQTGRVPLWNPCDDFGMSVAGDGSSSLFYPGKLLFLARSFACELRFAWYVALHVLLAAVAACLAARTAGCSYLAGALAGISYAFGGVVLFQTSNVVFLVGSAWLPMTLASNWRYLNTERSTTGWIIAGAISLSMMVLGGDPQMALMSGLAMIALTWTASGNQGWRRRLVGPLLMTGGAVALSAIQILPAIDWAAGSERILSPPGWFRVITSGDWSSLIREAPPGSHAAAIYEFSFAPWRIAEAVWPNILGKIDFVTETVWSSQLAGSDRLWTPSIYFGVITLILATGQFRCWHRQPGGDDVNRQLTWLLAVFLAGSFGWYGVGWLVNELQLMRGGTGLGAAIGKPAGGLYWWIVNLMPGFSSFRYPSKLLVPAMLAMCLLGGRGFDALRSASRSGGGRRFARCASGIGMASAGTLGLVVLVRNQAGGLSVPASHEVITALLHTTIVLGLACPLVAFIGTRASTTGGTGTEKACWLLLLLCAADVLVANDSLTGLVADSPEAGSRVASAVVYRHPDVDRFDFGQDRPWTLAEAGRVDRQSLRPKLNLLSGQRLVGSFASVEQLDMLLWKQAVAALSPAERRIILESCGVSESVNGIEVRREKGGDSRVAILTSRIEGLPRCRLVNVWSVLPEIDGRDATTVGQRTNRVLAEQIKKGREFVVIESDELPAASPGVPGDKLLQAESVVILRDEVDRLVLETRSSGDGLLLIADYFDKHWRATVSGNGTEAIEAPVFRANRLLRAVPVSGGVCRVTLQYRAAGLFAGLVTSAIAWLTVLLVLLQAVRAGRSRRAYFSQASGRTSIT